LAIVASACTARPTTPVAAPAPSPSAAPSPVVTVPSPVAAPSPTPPPLGKPVHDINGYLHTDGTQLVDEKNHPVRLFSIQINGMQKGSGSPDTVSQPFRGCFGYKTLGSEAFGLSKSWGFNSIRLQITWANLEATPPTKGKDGKLEHHYNQAYVKAIDDVVNGFAKKGIATIIEMNQVRWSPAFHQIPLPSGGKLCGTGMPTWLYPPSLTLNDIVQVEKDFFAGKDGVRTMFIDAWEYLAKRYRKNHMVIGADILNEPYDILVTSYPNGTDERPKDLDLKGFYEKAGSVIQKINPNWLLIFEENRSKRTYRWSVTGKPELPNVVMSAHWYPTVWNQEEGLPRLERYVARAKGWDVPLWVGEFNAFRYTSGRSDELSSWAGDLKKFLAYSKKNHVGWTITSYGSGQIQEIGSTQVKPQIISILRDGM
jgi:cellulase (glycosyl hydrolase family 5)